MFSTDSRILSPLCLSNLETIIRFLIADDPVSGKTIMAGLIIKELKLRNMIKRILIIDFAKREDVIPSLQTETTGSLTQNEWSKAKRFGEDYYIYIIWDAASSPELHIIQNPANNLKPEEKIEQVRYIVSSDLIKNYGVKV